MKILSLAASAAAGPAASGCDPAKLSELNWDRVRYVPALDDRFFAIVLADNRSPAAPQRAMRAPRVYAIRREGYRLRFTVDGNLMRARLERRAGAFARP